MTVSDLKTNGISHIERLLQDEEEVVVSVRSKPRYVMMDIVRYDFLRECEIAAACAQTREDMAGGRYRDKSADAHLARINDEFADAL